MTERKQDWGNSRRGATNFSSTAVASERMDPENLAVTGEDACMTRLLATAAPAATDNWPAMAVGPGTLLQDAKTPMTLGPNSPSSVTEPTHHTTTGMVEVPIQPWFPPSFHESAKPTIGTPRLKRRAHHPSKPGSNVRNTDRSKTPMTPEAQEAKIRAQCYISDRGCRG